MGFRTTASHPTTGVGGVKLAPQAQVSSLAELCSRVWVPEQMRPMCPAGPFLLASEVLWPPDHMHSLAWGPWRHLPIVLLGWMGLQALEGGWDPRRVFSAPLSELSPGEPEPWEVCAERRWPSGGDKASWGQPCIPETSEWMLPWAGVQGCHRPGGIWGTRGLLPPKKAHTSVSPALGCI